MWTSTRSVKLFTITRSVWDNDSVFRHANLYKALNASELDNFETDGANNCYCGIWYLICSEKSVDYTDCDFFFLSFIFIFVKQLCICYGQNPKFGQFANWPRFLAKTRNTWNEQLISGFSRPIRGVARNAWPIYEVEIQGWPIWGIALICTYHRNMPSFFRKWLIHQSL